MIRIFTSLNDRYKNEDNAVFALFLPIYFSIFTTPRYSLKTEVEFLLEAHAVAEENAIQTIIDELNNKQSDSDSELDTMDTSCTTGSKYDSAHFSSEDEDSDTESADLNSDATEMSEKDDSGFYRDVAAILKARLASGVPSRTQLNRVRSRRYLFRRAQNRPKLVTAERRLKFLQELDSDEFREKIQMSKSPFDKLIALIKDHSLYQNSARRPQKDIRLQVSIVLERLGTNGNGVSYSRMARRCGVGSKFIKCRS